jgi:hypothetical protein
MIGCLSNVTILPNGIGLGVFRPAGHPPAA